MHNHVALLVVHWISLTEGCIRCTQPLKRLDLGFYLMHGLNPRRANCARLAAAAAAQTVVNHLVGQDFNPALLLHLGLALLPRKDWVACAAIVGWGCACAKDDAACIHAFSPLLSFSIGRILSTRTSPALPESILAVLSAVAIGIATSSAWRGPDDASSVVASLCVCLWMVESLESSGVRFRLPLPTSALYVFSDAFLTLPWALRVAAVAYASLGLPVCSMFKLHARIVILEVIVFCTDELILFYQ